METERSPGLPSLMVTTRRRLMPQGTSCSFLHAVTQALHSMQRSASQRNFIRAIVEPPLRRPDLAQRGLGFLHAGNRIESVSRDRVYALAEHDGVALGDALLHRRFLHAEPDIRDTKLFGVGKGRIFRNQLRPRRVDGLAMHRDGIGQIPGIRARLAVAVMNATVLHRDALDA